MKIEKANYLCSDTVTSCTEKEAHSATETPGAIRPFLPASVSKKTKWMMIIMIVIMIWMMLVMLMLILMMPMHCYGDDM